LCFDLDPEGLHDDVDNPSSVPVNVVLTNRNQQGGRDRQTCNKTHFSGSQEHTLAPTI